MWEQNIDWPPPTCPLPGIEPETWACVLTRNQTGVTPYQVSHTGQSSRGYFYREKLESLKMLISVTEEVEDVGSRPSLWLPVRQKGSRAGPQLVGVEDAPLFFTWPSSGHQLVGLALSRILTRSMWLALWEPKLKHIHLLFLWHRNLPSWCL